MHEYTSGHSQELKHFHCNTFWNVEPEAFILSLRLRKVLVGTSYPAACKSFRGSHGDPRPVPPDVFCSACRSLWDEESSHHSFLMVVLYAEGDNVGVLR